MTKFLQTITLELHGTSVDAFWTGISYLLAATVFQPTFAALSHIFGRVNMLMVSLTIFTAGSLACALAKSFSILHFGRALQGLGGGGITTLTYIVVTDLVPLRERGKWFGYITMTWAVGSICGPLLGGAFTEKASWESSTFLQLLYFY